MKIEIKDNEIVADGKTYVLKEEKASQDAPRFIVGKWYVYPEDHSSYFEDIIYRVNEIKPNNDICFDISNDNRSCNKFDINSQFAIGSRLATPKEIESHLRKVCDEKYVGKRVKSLYNQITTVDRYSEYDKDRDAIFYKDTDGASRKVYQNGRWATILPDKKHVPTDRVAFKVFLEDYDDSDGCIDEFLANYDFKD